MLNDAMRRWKARKVTPFAELTIGTAIWPSRARLRTVADGCGRLRTVAQRLANTALPPHQSETGTLATHSGIDDREKTWYQELSKKIDDREKTWNLLSFFP